MTARSWTLTIPRPDRWLSANQRDHFLRRSDGVKVWRDAAHVHARSARLPQLRRAHILAELYFGDRRRRDVHNYYPTLKAVVDGLVDYGLLPDDGDEYLTGPDLRLGYGPYPPGVVLTIREVT
jgi:hypothetical protein